MFKELHTLAFIAEHLRERGQIPQNVSYIHQIYDFFLYLNENKQSFNSLYIFNYLFSYLSSDEVAKRKTSAKLFEDFLAVLFKGKVSDELKRKNLSYEVSDYFLNVKDKIASNRREKADLFFDDYPLSVKTIMQDNKELNMGSFDKNILFDGLNVEPYLNERRSKSGAGLGSKMQLLKLFSLIETLSSWENFRKKFIAMVEAIFSDDLLIAVKNHQKMQLVFLSGEEFITIFKDLSRDKNELLKIINRYEGNSLRIDRSLLFERASLKIVLDFSHLSSGLMQKINDFDLALHKNYALYFNGDKNAKKRIFEDLEKLFCEFERRRDD